MKGEITYCDIFLNFYVKKITCERDKNENILSCRGKKPLSERANKKIEFSNVGPEKIYVWYALRAPNIKLKCNLCYFAFFYLYAKWRPSPSLQIKFKEPVEDHIKVSTVFLFCDKFHYNLTTMCVGNFIAMNWIAILWNICWNFLWQIY